MKNDTINVEDSDQVDTNLKNILSINEPNHDDLIDEELMDYDFDYDPNEMYYQLLNED